jgi:hypothetical protein
VTGNDEPASSASQCDIERDGMTVFVNVDEGLIMELESVIAADGNSVDSGEFIHDFSVELKSQYCYDRV